MEVQRFRPGTAPIKAEYLISTEPRAAAIDDDAAESSTNHIRGTTGLVHQDDEGHVGLDGTPPGKRQKLSREEKKKRTGANKARRFAKMKDELELCWKVAVGNECEFGKDCRFTHDIDEYLAQKPKDLTFPTSVDSVSIQAYSAADCSNDIASVSELPPSVDPSVYCPVFDAKGECSHGFKCRFLGSHIRKTESGTLEIVKDEEKVARRKLDTTELNYILLDSLKQLRSKKYPQPITEAYLKELETSGNTKKEPARTTAQTTFSELELMADENESQKDTPDVPMRFNEKKRLNWRGLTYLAPLTTVGNLAPISPAEKAMGLATSFLQGSKEEWSLVRRHPSERTFGVQLAGSKPGPLAAIAEVMAREFGPRGIDFVDVNCGCPIDLVFRAGSGSALLDAPAKLSKILVGMSRALGEIPLTVKLRTGVKEGKNTAHKFMPRLAAETGIGAMTLHGRTRQQRYTKLADWDYIKECVDAVHAREVEEGLAPIPIFGGGDAYSSQDYWGSIDYSGVDGVMVGRGALIKPWIFTEIKERREWDISARERLELTRKYAEYGLNHFGSDTTGVNTTRRYLCEALSFTHRYIPIGLLEVLPGRLNDRPPAFRGRDELETLLASTDSRDWVKISEMFLGKAPEGWTFTPKHKSNSYGAEESQG
ncbi:zinc finger dihydrouridine synthase [Fomitiporia mediterranea MF3/22]|uniref:zinc finger dihydrouridine synthase n=1 Tax=Fomitiporia mediterranea (strain MF3/22) TaxID=694068 RepID=UPI000440822F|nr:zinc finger dihydrouridine synthase [Fomitiporia mediterranea MF3/22]EJD02013.1 zinc finger dihydrouridine synthase [Fomitiporia mediterranea MF3/22]